MKNLSTFEKNLIDKLLQLDGAGSLVVMNNILEFSLDDFDHMYIDNIDDCQCTLHIEERYFMQIEETGGVNAVSIIFEGANKKFLLMSSLFNMLISNDFVIVSGDIDCTFIGTRGNTTYITYNNLDTEVAYFIWKYCTKRFTPTEKLKTYVSNGYKTDEQLAIEAQAKTIKTSTFHANIALFVSFSGLIATIVPLFMTTEVELVNKKLEVGLSADTKLQTVNIASDMANNNTLHKPNKPKNKQAETKKY